MGRILRSFIIVYLVVFKSMAFAEYPGVTPGRFAVSDTGEATYTLPIVTPAGVNGMAPELAVTYNSSGDNGLLGVGFQLSGFTSSIHRCGGSHVTDGKASGVTYTNTDKLCLDGQRLILVKGSPFITGAEYRTEVDLFSRIAYKNGIFHVHSRDGELTLYGYKVKNSAGVVKRWLKNSVHDRTNNIVRYYYKTISDQVLGTERWVPWEVRWSGKGSDEGNRKVVFTYKTRPDKRSSYEYGIKYDHYNLIDKITTYIGSSKIKGYRFVYHKSPVSGLSRLSFIQQLGSDDQALPAHYFTYNDVTPGFGSSAVYKMPKDVYVYDYKDIKQDDSCGSCNDGYSVEVKRGDFVDLDNDGFVDFVESYQGEGSNTPVNNIYKNISNTRKTGENTWKRVGQLPVIMRNYRVNESKSTGKGEMLQSSVYADVDGDGYEDIITAYKNNGVSKMEVRKNKRNFTFDSPTNTSYKPPFVMWDYDEPGKGKARQISHLIDVNADGLPDWVVSFINQTGIEYNYTYINSGTGWTRKSYYDFPATAAINDYRTAQKMENAPVSRTEVVDLNGDGLVDLIQGLLSPDEGVDNGKTYRKVWLNNGAGWTSADYYQLPDYIHDYTRVNEVINGQAGNDSVQRRGDFIDVNGDGLVDWVRSFRDFKNGTDYTATWLNTGKGWVGHSGYRLFIANKNVEVIRNYSKARDGDPHGPESGSFFDVRQAWRAAP